MLMACALVYSLPESHAQNLAPNPSFEDYLNCPTDWYGFGEPLDCIPWVQGNAASADYYNACCVSCNISVPDNYFGYEPAHTGVGYTGMFLHDDIDNYREYIQAPLTEPLQAGVAYYVTFYVSLADDACGVRPIGAFFSSTPPPYDYNQNIDVEPQIFTNGPYLNNVHGWTQISGCFVALGGEAFVTIGNFLDDSQTPLDPSCNNNTQNSYYFLDDVVVEPMNEGFLALELGDPIVACYEYEIDPGLDGVVFHWSDGTTNSTLTVTQSGTYSLTISEACNFGIDEIEVTILGAPDVELPADSIICEGEVITISLDPDAGEYTWQDGSDDPEYSITTTGTYQVTLDDQCDVTMDTIYVQVIDLPEPFTLGPDQLLCAGDELEFSFDPDLGSFQWQDNSVSNEYTITEPGEYALTISNMCGGISDDVVITYLDPPVLDFGFTGGDLCVGETFLLSVDPSLGDYVWHDGSTEPFFLITGPGVYSATVTNPCGSSTDEVSFDLIEPPTVELGPDQIICAAQLPFILEPGSGAFSWDYNWQDGSGETTFPVVETGVYSVTVSNTCFEISDVIEIVVTNSLNIIQEIQTCAAADTGIFFQVINNPEGCDTIIETHVQLGVLDTTFLQTVTCRSGQQGVFSNTFSSINGCDS